MTSLARNRTYQWLGLPSIASLSSPANPPRYSALKSLFSPEISHSYPVRTRTLASPQAARRLTSAFAAVASVTAMERLRPFGLVLPSPNRRTGTRVCDCRLPRDWNQTGAEPPAGSVVLITHLLVAVPARCERRCDNRPE